ncbi:MAG: alpha-1,2-fucosyltransferase [Candidatus Obscuribacterales bacterium]|nr:alpha-1,2-fucosyltransferase [Candidatus Obscuribacterales bacterium]
MICFSSLGKFGRLGNQLFQIATTIAAAKRFDDTAKFPVWEFAKFFKGEFDQTLAQSEIKAVYREPHFHYAPVPYFPDLDLQGYFQSERHFVDCADFIRSQFEFVDDLLPFRWRNERYDCSIHVRRTDYTNKPHFHTNLEADYYLRAIKIMRECGSRSFLVFSDDIEWCRQNLPKDLVFVDDIDNVQSLCLLSRCHNHIIANSSFSWWGSWLSQFADKRIVAPTNWFSLSYRIGGEMDPRDLYCPEWQVIDHRYNVVRALGFMLNDMCARPRLYKRLLLKQPRKFYWY